ncbi:MAG TPA: selenocysteine-specific translation elongation factor [Streptosporangiaceae bacterium]|nr:selenocysteine-specific translation elongation factor [Streptosporangiaceae bacterium]
MHVVVTAGHVDHGKSMLVRALTGMEPDRWDDERRRGMTIDLGFAWTTLPTGEQIAFVDVPGHERFVSNMLAGAGPAPAVMFVVAADEGWKPQSAEHLAAIDALGVRHGLLVISRADLANPEPALREAADHLAGTSLGGIGDPVAAVAGHEAMEAVAVSALTGQGMDVLRAALGRLAARLPAPDPSAGVRLWLDRAFAIKGSGTVVTGTLQAGEVRAGDELVLTPAMRPLRIRGLQSLGAPADRVTAVARVALNVRGIGTGELSRGMALIRAGQWTVTGVIDGRLVSGAGQPGPDAAAMPASLTLHIGAARTIARVRALGGPIVRLTLAQPLPLHVGDRVLLRDPGAAAGPGTGHAIVGATVLDVAPVRLRGSGSARAAARELASWPDPPRTSDVLRRHRLVRAGDARAMGLRDLPAAVTADWVADPEHWLVLRGRLADAVTAQAARDPLAPGLSVDAARAQLRLPDRRLVAALAAWSPEGAGSRIEVAGGYLRPGTALPSRVAEAVTALLASMSQEPFDAPDAGRLAALGLDARAAAAAERAGLLLRLPGGVVLPADAVGRASKVLAGLPQPFTAAEARQALRTSRRVVIPLLERLDRDGVTRRLSDNRRIVRGGGSAEGPAGSA